MNLKKQNYFSIIRTLQKNINYYLFLYQDNCYIFESFTYKIYKIDTLIFHLVQINDTVLLLQEIEKISYSDSIEKSFITLSILVSQKKSKHSYCKQKNIAFLNLNISSKCNLDCIYCFRDKNSNSKTDISLLKQSIDYLIDSNPTAELYSIAIDLSSEIFMERDILQKTIDYIFTKECYFFQEDEFKSGTILDFYNMLPEKLISKKCFNETDALIEINQLLKNPNLLNLLDIESIKNEKPYLYQQSQISQYLPLWKLVRSNHEGLEAFYPDYIKHKRRKGISLWFMSNGTFINQDDINLIKGLEINPFTISLDGPPEIHNKLRPFLSNKGSYENVISSIKLLQKNNINVKISLVLTTLYPYPFELIKFLLSLNIYQVKMTLIRDCKELEFSKKTIRVLLDNYSLLFSQLENDLINGNFSLFKFLNDDISLKPLHNLLNNTFSTKRCLWKEEIVVDSKGDIYPCTYTCKNTKFLIGNIFSKNTIELEKELFIDYRSKCKNCWARYLCGGTCYYNTYKEKNKIDTYEATECVVNKFFCEKCINLYLLIKTNNIKTEELFT